MTLEQLNNLAQKEIESLLQQCCNATKWYKVLAAQFPVQSVEELEGKADRIWATCEPNDWLEAFEAHPKIGDVKSLAKKFAATKSWAGNEQSAVELANQKVIEDLAAGNKAYETKFGFIFIVFATGKTAQQMLDLLLARLPNERVEELKIAATEQHKITKLRIKKLLA